MKGVVFTEFLELVDQAFSPDMAEEVVMACDLPSGGVYTATGTYNHEELLAMVVELSRRTDVAVGDLVKTFGHHLFKVFVKSFPVKIKAEQEYFQFLKSVNDYIHVEVTKLYPDASLPKISCQEPDENTLEMNYESACPFAQLANGLLHESADHFKADVTIEQKNKREDGSAALFTIRKKS